MKMVTVNILSSGAQKIHPPVTVTYHQTNCNYSASVRTQHYGRAETAMRKEISRLSFRNPNELLLHFNDFNDKAEL